MERRFCFTIGEQKYYARMKDTPLVGQIAAMCPFEQTYTRHSENEYYTRLLAQGSQEESGLISKAHKNQVCFFEGWNALSLLFEECDIAPYQSAYLGEFEEDIAAALRDAKSTLVIRCEDVQNHN